MKINFLVTFLGFLSLNVAEQVEIVCEVSKSDCTFTGQIIDQDDIVNIRVEPAGSNLNSVSRVKFEQSSIFYIPPELFDVFVNLKRLDIHNQNVQEIRPSTLKNAGKLEYLDIQGNKITHLYANMFDGAENLKLIACSGQMKVENFDIDVNAFAGESESDLKNTENRVT